MNNFQRFIAAVNGTDFPSLTWKVASKVTQAQDEKKWLTNRSRGIGGSDVGPIMGVSPFTSARQVYLNKTGQFTDAMEPSDAARERMHFGHVLEPIVASEYIRRNKNNGVKAIHEVGATLCMKDAPWALANIDRLVEYEDGELGVLECKTAGEYSKDDWENGDLLLTYIYQLQWYLKVLGLKKGAFACLVGGNKFFHYDVFADETLQNILFDRMYDFWFNNVQKLVEPTMTEVDTEFANNAYADVIKGSEIALDKDENGDDIGAEDLCELIHNKSRKIKELEREVEAAKNQLKDMLKEHEFGVTASYLISWSPRNQKRVDTNRLRTEYPEAYEACLKPISFRAMSVKEVLPDDEI